MKRVIEPKLVGGTRDYLPEDMIPRQAMFDTIRRTFELFGFVPLDTPSLERRETLTGGDPGFSKQIFSAGVQSVEGEGLALRFDLTVPLARVVAQYQEIGRPFKRYQMGKVFRGESPQAGRFREFVQFDADIVGSNRTVADAEIIALMNATLQNLGFGNFTIRVNNRKILNGLSQFVGFDPTNSEEVFRLIDKLDKLGWDNIAGEMSDKLGFSSEQLARLRSFVDFRAGSLEKTVEGVRDLMVNSPIALEGILELEKIVAQVRKFGVPDENWVIDLSVARGLGYYTGPVFETVLNDLPSIGSVFSGGRYDGLVERFGSSSVPATGASVGVDRLFAAMEKLGLVKQQKTTAQVLVLNFDENAELECLEVTTNLRNIGISTELYLGKESTLKGQMSYGVKREIPVLIIIGSSELEKGEVSVKDMRNRTQVAKSKDSVVAYIRSLL